MELTEAVSILRDEIRRGQSEWGPTRVGRRASR